MKVLSTLFMIVLVLLAISLITPIVTFGFALLCGIAAFAIWLTPVWIIATSDKTTGGEKIAWLLAMFFLSWFAWVFYFFLAPLKSPHEYRY